MKCYRVKISVCVPHELHEGIQQETTLYYTFICKGVIQSCFEMFV